MVEETIHLRPVERSDLPVLTGFAQKAYKKDDFLCK